MDNSESKIPAPAPVAAPPHDEPIAPLDRDDRTLGILCHVSSLAFFAAPFIGHLLGPLAVWLLGRKKSPFVDANGREALNFNLTVSLAWLVCVPLFWVYYIGAILLAPIFLTWLAFVLIASARTADSVVYRYPVRIAFIREPAAPAAPVSGGDRLQ